MSVASAVVAHRGGSKTPRVTSLRLVGSVAERARGRLAPPFGAAFASDAPAYALALGPAVASDLAGLARELPDPDELPAGTLVFVLPTVVDPPSLTNRFLAALGRGRTVTRELRSTALVARGYVDVAAGVDPASRSDLVWGYAPAAAGT